MSTLASELRPAGADLPAVALLQTALAPVVCVGMLGAAMLAHGEPFAARYSGLALIAFFLSLQVFGALPLANGAGPRPLFGPASRLAVRWAAVVGILLFLGFLTKLSGLYSRKVMLTWFALTPFALHIAQEFACRLLPRLAIGAARTRVIVGANGLAHELARRIAEDPCLGEVKGFFDDAAPGQERASGRLPLLGGLQDVPDYVKRHGVNLVYIALPTTADPKVRRLLERLRDTTASVYFVPDTLAVDLIQPRIESIGGLGANLAGLVPIPASPALTAEEAAFLAQAHLLGFVEELTIDLLPTVARLIGARLPELPIDGRDIGPMLFGEPGAKSPHEAYYFYWGRELQAVRMGRWKLHFPHGHSTLGGREGGKGGIPAKYDTARIELSLFDLEKDPGETVDVKAGHPEVVEKIRALAEGMRKDLGDSATKQVGSGVRDPGRLSP